MCDQNADMVKELTDIAASAIAENRRLIEKVNRMAEMIRIKDDLINQQIKRIMHLEGVRG